jgi:hypothetical protein
VLEKIRKATVAGQFYPGNRDGLIRQIEECFLDKRGCGELPKVETGEKNIKGLVVPHAGYVYSGAIASHAYMCLAKNGFADVFVILGPNHTGIGSGVAVMTEGNWETPLGAIPIDTHVAEEIHTGIVDQDERAHMYEHSIEVQLPFLQYIKSDFSFVPISMMMQDIETAQEVGNIVANAVKKTGKKIVIIASTDFSHAGFNYSSMPPSGMRVDEYAEKQDKLATDKILSMDAKGLIKTVQEKGITMCGYGPVAAMLTATTILNASKVELLKYGTSYEVQPGSSCVGYGSLIVY